MATLFKTASLLALVALTTITMGSTVAGQAPAAPPQGGAPGRGAPPPPPAAQPGHPTGKLVIWGDLASFDAPATSPTHCILTNRFKRGQKLGVRMTAIDGGTGEFGSTAVMTAHLTVAGKTIDLPMRWRGVGGAPPSEYPHQPTEMWTGTWVVPAETPTGTINYTVTATDRFGRTASFSPFINTVSQITIID